MTPMTKLKNEFTLLKELLGSKFKETVLNKATPKVTGIQVVPVCLSYGDEGIQYFEKKGVKSDFLRILKLKEKDVNYSIAFSIKYIGLKPEEQKCKYSVKRTIKNIDKIDFFNSEEISIEELGNKINSVLKTLKENSYSEEEKVKILNSAFLGDDLVLTKNKKISKPKI